MRKITANAKIEFTKEEVGLIKNICELWDNLNDEFGEIDEIEFTSLLCNVANDEKYTWLDHEEVEIVKEKDNDSKNYYKPNTKEEIRMYNRGYDDGYEIGYTDAIGVGY